MYQLLFKKVSENDVLFFWSIEVILIYITSYTVTMKGQSLFSIYYVPFFFLFQFPQYYSFNLCTLGQKSVPHSESTISPTRPPPWFSLFCFAIQLKVIPVAIDYILVYFQLMQSTFNYYEFKK